MFSNGSIDGVIIKEFLKHNDSRGWLAEMFREDDPGDYRPAMGYISVTHAGITRGPHEHIEQTDYFCFLGDFTLYLWDNREDSLTYRNKMVIENSGGKIVIVPPRVVHAYKNSGTADGMVLNFPDRLFAGQHKKEKVDEVRYENDPETPFKIEK